jgi:hypothetical protein
MSKTDQTPAQLQAAAMAAKEGNATPSVYKLSAAPAQVPEFQYTRPSRIVASNADDNKVLATAQMLYGEFGGEGKNPELQKQYMKTGASAAYNTFGKGEWAGRDWDTHLYKNFYAVQNHNQPYQEALNGDFKTPESQASWKRAMQIAYGIESGNIPVEKGQFYFTPEERQKNFGGPSIPNPDKLELVRNVGKYEVYQYKQNKPVAKIQEALKTSGFYKGEVDGMTGPQTKAAIKQFQVANGLKPDGIVGKQTRAALFSS